MDKLCLRCSKADAELDMGKGLTPGCCLGLGGPLERSGGSRETEAALGLAVRHSCHSEGLGLSLSTIWERPTKDPPALGMAAV